MKNTNCPADRVTPIANTLLFAEGWHPVLLSSQEHPGLDWKDAHVTAKKPAGAERWLLWASNPF
jgi:hypothetical protein